MSGIDQVVCVSDDWGQHSHLLRNCPVVGGVYTIRRVFNFSAEGYPADTPYFWLEEVINPSTEHPDFPGSSGEPTFCSKFFRPVRRTDISSLMSLLLSRPRVGEPA